MNYFAHGLAHIDQPWFLAGTAVPDWLNVVDRKLRLRREQVLPWADGSGSLTSQFAEGILKHLEDDEWFHATPGFEQATSELTRAFREHLKPLQENPRAGFLGHIATELLLDRALISQDIERLEEYYRSLATVDPVWIEETVSRISGQSANSLAWFCEEFQASRFLFDYLEPAKLLFRLNQVVRRIKLSPLPESTTEVLIRGSRIVDRLLPELLPAELFPLPIPLKENLP